MVHIPTAGNYYTKRLNNRVTHTQLVATTLSKHAILAKLGAQLHLDCGMIQRHQEVAQCHEIKGQNVAIVLETEQTTNRLPLN